MKLYKGSKVVNFTDSWGTLFVPSDWNSLIGRSFNQTKDIALVMNGDNTAQLGVMITTAAHSDGTVRLYARSWNSDAKVSGNARINWMVIS